MLNITENISNGALVATLHGRIDAMGSKTLEEQASTWITAGNRHLIIDCTPLEYISSAGLRALLLIAKQVNVVGGSLKLCGISGPVHEVFEISGFSRLFAILPSVADALHAPPEERVANGAR